MGPTWNMLPWAVLIFLLFLSSLISRGDAVAAELHLTWTDNSTNESGFQIERRIGTDGVFVHVGTVGADISSYTDAGLTPGTSYCYRVRAFTANETSAYSNVACATTTTLMAVFESQGNGQPVSGIAVIRGWSFDTQASGLIRDVKLLIDGIHSGHIPCCSQRADVQAAFPEFPAQNTLNSGWGAVFNWGLLSPGLHTVRLEIESTSGNALATETRTVVAVKPGDFEFLDRFDLSGALASIVGDELVVEGVVVCESTTWQEKEIDTRFRWFASSQSLVMTEAVTIAELFSFRSLVSSLLASLPTWLSAVPAIAEIRTASAASGIAALFESPVEGQVASGIGVIRGWAFAEEAGVSIAEVRLLIDGQPGDVIPCCSQRDDVATAFPGHPDAQMSGWGTPFNYGLLEAGPHTIGVQIRDSTGALRALDHEVVVVKPGGFEFLDQFDLSEAIPWIAGEEIVVEGVRVRDKVSQQTVDIDVRLRWFTGSQSLEIVSSLP